MGAGLAGQARLGADREAGELFQVAELAGEKPAGGGWREGQGDLVPVADERLQQALAELLHATGRRGDDSHHLLRHPRQPRLVSGGGGRLGLG
ncbi:MAG: hypothetical protein QOH03_1116 [Kribbellaceae bacterium]|jgi:hypothetical protein|nr:hypothetical protein [Kribbellaceae bacterium]